MNYYPWDLALLTACYRPERFCAYSCQYGQAAGNPHNQFSLYDGRLTPAASQYVVTLQFLRDAERGQVLSLKNAGQLSACAFQNGALTWVALHAPAPALRKELILPISAEDYQILDHHLLESKAQPVPGEPGASRLIMRRGEGFFLGSEKTKIIQAVENLQAQDQLEIRHLLAAAGQDLECRTWLRNNTRETVRGQLTLYQDMLQRRNPTTFAFELQAEEEKIFVRKQDSEAFRHPLSYFPVQSELWLDNFFPDGSGVTSADSRKEGENLSSGEFFFTHYAIPVETGFKGDQELARLDKWQETQWPAAVLLNWGGSSPIKRAQVRAGGDMTDCHLQPDGSFEAEFCSLHFVRYSRDALLLGAIIEDAPVFAPTAAGQGEEIVYVLQPDLLKELGSRTPANIIKICVRQSAPNRLAASLLRPDGSRVELRGTCAYDGGRIRKYLVQAPFRDLGFQVRPGLTIGFNILCRDSDTPDGQVESELDWAGAAYAPGDAFGFGQLIVK
jgi:hypothetical protein